MQNAESRRNDASLGAVAFGANSGVSAIRIAPKPALFGVDCRLRIGVGRDIADAVIEPRDAARQVDSINEFVARRAHGVAQTCLHARVGCEGLRRCKAVRIVRVDAIEEKLLGCAAKFERRFRVDRSMREACEEIAVDAVLPARRCKLGRHRPRIAEMVGDQCAADLCFPRTFIVVGDEPRCAQL